MVLSNAKSRTCCMSVSRSPCRKTIDAFPTHVILVGRSETYGGHQRGENDKPLEKMAIESAGARASREGGARRAHLQTSNGPLGLRIGARGNSRGIPVRTAIRLLNIVSICRRAVGGAGDFLVMAITIRSATPHSAGFVGDGHLSRKSRVSTRETGVQFGVDDLCKLGQEGEKGKERAILLSPGSVGFVSPFGNRPTTVVASRLALSNLRPEETGYIQRDHSRRGSPEKLMRMEQIANRTENWATSGPFSPADKLLPSNFIVLVLQLVSKLPLRRAWCPTSIMAGDPQPTGMHACAIGSGPLVQSRQRLGPKPPSEHWDWLAGALLILRTGVRHPSAWEMLQGFGSFWPRVGVVVCTVRTEYLEPANKRNRKTKTCTEFPY